MASPSEVGVAEMAGTMLDGGIAPERRGADADPCLDPHLPQMVMRDLDGVATAAEQVAVARALAADPLFAAEVERMRILDARLASLSSTEHPATSQDSGTDRISALVRRLPEPQPQRSDTAWLTTGILALVLALVVIQGAIVWLLVWS